MAGALSARHLETRGAPKAPPLVLPFPRTDTPRFAPRECQPVLATWPVVGLCHDASRQLARGADGLAVASPVRLSEQLLAQVSNSVANRCGQFQGGQNVECFDSLLCEFSG